MATVNVDITTNAQQAAQQVEELNQQVTDLGNNTEDVANSGEKLGKSLEKQEIRLKKLDGIINIVGGSVELLAGGLAASGLVTEENAEKFEAAAIGAIAFADGTKRVLDGVKTFTEAQKLATTATNAATAAQEANNLAVLANPYVAAAAAVAALAAGLFLLAQRNKTVLTEENLRQGALNKIKKETEAAAIAQADFNRSLDIEQNRQRNSIELLKARGATLEEIYAAERALLATRIADARLTLAEQERQNAELEKAVKITEDVEKRTGGVTVATKQLREELEASKDRVANQTKELDNLNTELKLLYVNYQNAQREIASQPIELAIKTTVKDPITGKDIPLSEALNIKVTPPDLQPIVQSIPAITAPAEEARKKYANAALAFQAFLEEANTNLNDFFASNTAAAIGGTLQTVSQFATTLSNVQDTTTKEGFEKAKKYKIAEVVTSAIQSAFQAFGAAQQFGPILGPILGAAQVAAIAIASNKAIQDIKSSTFNDSSTAGISSITAGSGRPSSNPAFQAGGFLGPTTPTTPNIQPEPIRAYVIANDVQDGLEANAVLNGRRRLGG